MRRLRHVPTLLILAVSACGGLDRDRTTRLPSERPVEEARAVFKEASLAFAEKRFDDAVDLYEEVYETWPSSTLASEAEFWAAESLYWDDEPYESYLALKEYLEFHGISARWSDRIEKRLLAIGRREFVEGRSGYLGLGIFTYAEQGVEVLEFLAATFPKGRHPDDALMEVARFQRSDGDLPAAVTTFQELLKRYPESKWRFQARLLLAASHRELNRGPPYDPATLRHAREEYETYIRRVSADEARAAENASRIALAEQRIEEIDETLGAKELLAARWYIHLEEDEAATLHLRRAASDYAQTEAGREAAEILRSMGRDVPEPGTGPVPPSKEPAAPATGS